MVSLFNGKLTFVGYLYAQTIHVEESTGTTRDNRWRDKRAHTFPEDASTNVNVIEKLVFDLANFATASPKF